MDVTKFASILPTENILKGWDVETTLSVYLVIVKQCTNCKKTEFDVMTVRVVYRISLHICQRQRLHCRLHNVREE